MLAMKVVPPTNPPAEKNYVISVWGYTKYAGGADFAEKIRA